MPLGLNRDARLNYLSHTGATHRTDQTGQAQQQTEKKEGGSPWAKAHIAEVSDGLRDLARGEE